MNRTKINSIYVYDDDLSQDAHGGIWRLDLSFSFTSVMPECLLSCHSGAITGCCASPVTNMVATAGSDRM